MSFHFFDQECRLVRRYLHAGKSLADIRHEICNEDGFNDEQLFLLVVAAKIMNDYPFDTTVYGAAPTTESVADKASRSPK